YALGVGVVAILGSTGLVSRRLWRAGRGGRRVRAEEGARWAGACDLGPLCVRRPVPGRLTLGLCGRRLPAAEAGPSVLVLGPTGSLKTHGLCVPAILEWPGHVVAVSVKRDLLEATRRARTALGPVLVVDPTGPPDPDAACWSPLLVAGS